MKRDTRRAILDMAKTLFSQQGYNAVSIGEIAGALGISKGNVTYHFKRKEDIMRPCWPRRSPPFFKSPLGPWRNWTPFWRTWNRPGRTMPFTSSTMPSWASSPRDPGAAAGDLSQPVGTVCPGAVHSGPSGHVSRGGFSGAYAVWRIPFSSPPFTGFPSVRSRGGRRISGPRPGLCCIPC